jgi:hypothetical protein
VSVHFQTTPTRLEQSILTFPSPLDFPQWRWVNLTLAPGSVTSHQEFSTQRDSVSDFLTFRTERQIKSKNVVMRATDNPVGSTYRFHVKDVASAQPHTEISVYRIRQAFPFCD